MSEDDANPPHAVSPAASGPAGARFEGKVGAFYLLALLGSGEPRGLPGATARAVRFQQSAQDRPLDDVTIDAINADGTDAFLDIQAKRTIDFTRADANFADVVRRLWATSQMQQFATTRYEMAVAVARTSTRIERDCQQVLQWARQLGDGGSFAAHMQRAGFASNGMRGFVDAFRHHLAAAATDAKIARGEDVALPAAVWAAIESGEHPIRAIRKYRGLTQIDVAEQAGLRQGYIADIEAGKKTGSATSLKAIAAALGVPLDVIVG